MFGTSVFLSQYMQLARGKTPTESGLLTLPMIAGLLIASTVDRPGDQPHRHLEALRRHRLDPAHRSAWD